MKSRRNGNVLCSRSHIHGCVCVCLSQSISYGLHMLVHVTFSRKLTSNRSNFLSPSFSLLSFIILSSRAIILPFSHFGSNHQPSLPPSLFPLLWSLHLRLCIKHAYCSLKIYTQKHFPLVKVKYNNNKQTWYFWIIWINVGNFSCCLPMN